MIQTLQGVSKKRNLFDLEYLQGGFVKLILRLGGYLVLPYNSIKPNIGSYDDYRQSYDV